MNLSARHFQQRDIASLVTSVLHETGLEPRYLELELTESAIMRNAEEAVMMLSELSALGIGIAIDDFGTGYSSLSYLKPLSGASAEDRPLVRRGYRLVGRWRNHHVGDHRARAFAGIYR